MFVVLLLHEKQMHIGTMMPVGAIDWEIHMSKKWKITPDGFVGTTSTAASVVMNAWRQVACSGIAGVRKTGFNAISSEYSQFFLNFL